MSKSLTSRLRERVPVVAAVLMCGFVAPRAAIAQAWVPPAGDGFVSIDYQNFSSPGHLNRLGQKGGGGTQSHSVLFEVEYGITDRIALTAALPFITVKYTGEGVACPLCVASNLPFELSHLDDGAYHGTLQDFRFGMRYNVVRKGLFLTPFLSAIVPSHHYENEGEAAVGRRFFEGQIGINAGRDLGPLLPRAYVQGRYSYALVPRDVGVRLNRSNVILEGGYSITTALAVRGLSSWQETHGGVPGVLPILAPDGLFPDAGERTLVLQSHDRLLQDNNWRVGAGASYVLRESVELSGTVLTVVSGTNTHRGTGVTVGMTWSFSRNQVLASVGPGVRKTKTPGKSRLPAGLPAFP
jgi:hypothetical protein